MSMDLESLVNELEVIYTEIRQIQADWRKGGIYGNLVQPASVVERLNFLFKEAERLGALLPSGTLSRGCALDPNTGILDFTLMRNCLGLTRPVPENTVDTQAVQDGISFQTEESLINYYNSLPDTVKQTLTLEQLRQQSVIETVLIEYFILTPVGSITDLVGNVVNKVSELTIQKLTVDQRTLLQSRNYIVEPVNGRTPQDFANTINYPVSYNGSIINGHPVTVFIDGTTSTENRGVFDPAIAEAGFTKDPDLFDEGYVDYLMNQRQINATSQEGYIPESDRAFQPSGQGSGLGILLLLALAGS